MAVYVIPFEELVHTSLGVYGGSLSVEITEDSIEKLVAMLPLLLAIPINTTLVPSIPDNLMPYWYLAVRLNERVPIARLRSIHKIKSNVWAFETREEHECLESLS